MSSTTVAEFASELKPANRNAAGAAEIRGCAKQSASDALTDGDKQRLLSYLQASHGTAFGRAPSARRSRCKARQVEVRKKRTFQPARSSRPMRTGKGAHDPGRARRVRKKRTFVKRDDDSRGRRRLRPSCQGPRRKARLRRLGPGRRCAAQRKRERCVRRCTAGRCRPVAEPAKPMPCQAARGQRPPRSRRGRANPKIWRTPPQGGRGRGRGHPRHDERAPRRCWWPRRSPRTRPAAARKPSRARMHKPKAATRARPLVRAGQQAGQVGQAVVQLGRRPAKKAPPHPRRRGGRGNWLAARGAGGDRDRR
jgi:translation initiation factor IF-2